MHIMVRHPSTLFDRYAWKRATRVAGAVATVVASTVAGAQERQAHQGQQPASPFRISPATVVIDPRTQTARFHLINTAKTWESADFTLRNTAPQPAGTNPSSAPSATTDSATRARSLETWITKLPPQVMLSPHETLTVTLQFTVPKTLPPGEYSAYVVAHLGERPTASDGISTLGTLIGGMVGGSDSSRKDSVVTVFIVTTGASDTTKRSDSSAPGADTSKEDLRPFATAKLVYRVEKK